MYKYKSYLRPYWMGLDSVYKNYGIEYRITEYNPNKNYTIETPLPISREIQAELEIKPI